MVDIRLAHRSGIQPMPSEDSRPIPGGIVEPVAHQGFSLPQELEAGGAFDQEENLERQVADDGAPARVVAWRRALLDLSLRNPLLKLPKRGKGLDLYVPAGSLARLDDLVHSGKAIHVVAQDTGLAGLRELQGVQQAQDLPDTVIAEELSKDRRVYGSVTEAGYIARMRGLQRDARTLQQETGSNYLYLTLGSLVHPTPTGEAHAPLFLLPVRIEGGAGHKPYTMLIDGDELAAPNYCLVQWLRARHGVKIDELEQPILDEHGIDIDASFRAIKKALVEANLGYRVDETASLRLLQFSTFQMWRDLTDHWRVLTRNPVVRHLVENSGKPLTQEPLRDEFEESALHLPIAADGSQMRAVVTAAEGQSFVLEGPPGTGKSQTITNLIAHAVSSGKTVLFVAEKQAALDVVKRRLGDIGMEPFCLDLHGRKQNGRSIHTQLKKALEYQPNADGHGWQALEAGYRAQIGALRRYPDALHTDNAAGYSAWSAYQARLAQTDGPRAMVPATFLDLTAAQREEVGAACRELVAAASSARLRARHPWMVSGRRQVSGLDRETVTSTVIELEGLRQEFNRFPQRLQACVAELDHPSRLADALEAARLARAGRLPHLVQTRAAMQADWDSHAAVALRSMAEFADEHRAALAMFRPELFAGPNFDDLVAQADAAGKGLFGRRKRRTGLVESLGPYLVPGAVLDQTAVLAAFQSAMAARHSAGQVAAAARAVPGLPVPEGWWPTWSGAAQALQEAHRAMVVSRALYGHLPALWHALAELGPTVPNALDRIPEVWVRWLAMLKSSATEFAQWSADLGWVGSWNRDGSVWSTDVRTTGLLQIQRWGAVLMHTDVLAEAGLADFRRQILTGEVPAEEIELSFLRGLTQTALDERLRAGELEYFDANSHARTVEDYLRSGQEIRRQLPEKLANTIVSRRTTIDRRFAANAGELVRRLNSRRDRLSFRDACAEHPEIVTGLTPCFLMSPASVATFLRPGSATFDIVVFDEASQIRVAQAIGAMGRARSVVVVGDSKQMPPTSVMQAVHADDTETPTVPEDLDSILTECVESGLPRERLTWHYRSRNEALISFSNAYYYDDALASLPSPGGDPTTGIFWHRVDGQFDRGAKARRINVVEAQAIVAKISQLLADRGTADRSIGVVTFNVQQRDLLLNLVEESTDPRIQAALARDDGEALFVKNLENVQGDERDVILFSLAFSKDPDTGRLPLNFGPLSMQGGERRLNVAVTRARTQVILFSSFDPADIDLTRTNALGTQHLRAYLEFAAGGLSRSGDVSNRKDRGRDRLAEEIAALLRERGHEVQLQFGLSRFTVDLAVRTPGSPRWQVAVLLDGPAWRQRSTVADRDAAPQLLDQVMNWPAVARIWLPQWINDRDTVLNAIDALVAGAELDPGPQLPTGAESPQGDSIVHDEAPIALDVEVESIRTTDSTLATQIATTVVVQAASGITERADFVPYPVEMGEPVDLDSLSRDYQIRSMVQAALQEVIEFEGPIELSRLIRLVHKRFGMDRVHPDRMHLMARFIPMEFERTTFGGTKFLWPSHRHPDSWRGFRRNRNSNDRRFSEIAPEEIANAIDEARRTGQARDDEELYSSTIRLLGYGRRTAPIRRRIAEVVTWVSTTDRRTH